MRTIHVTRYATPLREGGSLPAIVEADDDGLYVLKFRGAGQGVKALIAELVAGEIARILGLSVPEIVLADLDLALSRTEPDPEIQDLLRSSAGLNLALDYLPGSITFDPLVDAIDSTLASQIVWFDCFVMNIDRTPRNPNLLMWHKKLWLIDHGASLYFHHNSADWQEHVRKPLPKVGNHVLLSKASELESVDHEFGKLLTAEKIKNVTDLIPDEWLSENSSDSTVVKRQAYTEFLANRVAASEFFVKEAHDARQKLV